MYTGLGLAIGLLLVLVSCIECLKCVVSPIATKLRAQIVPILGATLIKVHRPLQLWCDDFVYEEMEFIESARQGHCYSVAV